MGGEKHQSEDAWYRREWDEFGFESVNPVSSVPQTANEISTSMNPGCRQRVRVHIINKSEKYGYLKLIMYNDDRKLVRHFME